jgi:hypothetical protein
MQRAVEPDGRLIVALLNSLVWRQRVRFLQGKFRYTDGGLMDRIHFRFFDWTSTRALVAGAGFREISAYADGGFPLALGLAALRMAPGLFDWQFVIVAEPFTGKNGDYSIVTGRLGLGPRN